MRKGLVVVAGVALALGANGCQIGAHIAIPRAPKADPTPAEPPTGAAVAPLAAPPPVQMDALQSLPEVVDLTDGLSVEEALRLALERNPRLVEERAGAIWSVPCKLRASSAPCAVRDVGAAADAGAICAVVATAAAAMPPLVPDFALRTRADALEDGGAASELRCLCRADSQRTVFAQVRAAFYGLLHAQRRRALAVRFRERMVRIEEIASAAVEKELLAASEADRVRQARVRADRDLETCNRRQEDAASALALLVGGPATVSPLLAGEFPERVEVAPRADLVARALQARSDLRAARLRSQSAARSAPGSVPPAGVTDRTDPDVETLAERVRGQVHDAQVRLTQALARVEYFEREILPGVELHHDGARTGDLALGRAAVADVLRPLAEEDRIQGEHLDCLYAYSLARVALDEAVGAAGAVVPAGRKQCAVRVGR